MRVLLADHRHSVRHNVACVLKSAPGVQAIAEAATQKELLSLAWQLGPDLVFLDASLAESPAAEMIQAIQTACPTAHIVALAGLDQQDTVHALRAAGAIGFVITSQSPPAMCDAIRKWVEWGREHSVSRAA